MILQNYTSEPFGHSSAYEGLEWFANPLVMVLRQPIPRSIVTYAVMTIETVGSVIIFRVRYYDPVDGSLRAVRDLPFSNLWLTASFVMQDRDGVTWFHTNFAGELWQKVHVYNWSAAGESFRFDDYVPDISAPIAFDVGRKVLLSCTVAGSTPVGVLSVYSMETHARVRTIALGSAGRYLLLEDDERVFVVCDSGIVILVNYVSGAVLGTYRIAYDEEDLAADKRFAWDPFSRRILVVSSAYTRIRGYHPIPIVSALTEPIPLSVARKGRTIRVATRAYGDTGEPITGKSVLASVEGPGRLRSARAITDAAGYAIHTLTCDDDGTQDFAVEVTQ